MLKFDEIKCYLRFCLKRPYVWPAAIGYILNRRYLRIRNQLHLLEGHRNRLHHYPREIRRQAQQVSSQMSLARAWMDYLPTTGWAPGDGLDLEAWTIPLATYSLPFAALDWDKEEKDPEDVFALQRFTWLLRWLSLHPAKEALKTADATLLAWIEQVGARKDSAAWEAYSVSERVVNWLLYLCATKGYREWEPKSIEILSAALLEHLNYIAQYLEYYPDYNNHILNNARALYIGGRFLQLPQVADLGKAVLQRHIPELIDEWGALLEDSSHYQLLLTRTLVEILWAAQSTNDAGFAEYLEGVSRAMIGCCLYIGSNFAGDWADNFSRVGDVSPDYPISWFYPDSRYSQQKETWWGLWGATTMPVLIKSIAPGVAPAEVQTEWRWVFGAGDAFSVLIHTRHNLKTYPRSHGHLDFGSFLLYDTDGPLLVDRGRRSYSNDAVGIYGQSAGAHNTTLINGLPLLPTCRGPFASYKEYLTGGIKTDIFDEGERKRIVWQTEAIDRLAGALRWRRDLVVSPNGVEGTEAILNPRGAALTIESYLHWAPGWSVRPDSPQAGSPYRFVSAKNGKRYRCEIDPCNADCRIDWFEGDNAHLHGWHFPEYGCQIPAITMRVLLQTMQDCNLKLNLYPL